MQEISKEALSELWWTHSTRQIAEKLKTSTGNVYKWANAHGLPNRRKLYHSMEKTNLDPSEEEIAERAAAIRASWTEAQLAERWVAGPKEPTRYEIPGFRFRNKRGALVAELI